MTNFPVRWAIVILAAGLLGCGEGGGPNPKAEMARLDDARSLRSLFDRAGGDYAKLSAADRAEFIRLNDGNSTKAEDTWNVMKYGPAAHKENRP